MKRSVTTFAMYSAGAIWLSSAFASGASGSSHLIYMNSYDNTKATGAFFTVCMEADQGLAILKEAVPEYRWGSGAKMSATNAAEQLPFFNSPVLVTTECLQEVIDALHRLGRAESQYTVRDL